MSHKETSMSVWVTDENGQNEYLDIGSVNDGYHTFDELYDHRMALTLALMRCNPEISWRSKNHHPNGEPMFDGFFVVGMNLPAGQISYHYKLEHWNTFKDIREIEHAPKWDGHTPEDVIYRLLAWPPENGKIKAWADGYETCLTDLNVKVTFDKNRLEQDRKNNLCVIKDCRNSGFPYCVKHDVP